MSQLCEMGNKIQVSIDALHLFGDWVLGFYLDQIFKTKRIFWESHEESSQTFVPLQSQLLFIWAVPQLCANLFQSVELFTLSRNIPLTFYKIKNFNWNIMLQEKGAMELRSLWSEIMVGKEIEHSVFLDCVWKSGSNAVWSAKDELRKSAWIAACTWTYAVYLLWLSWVLRVIFLSITSRLLPISNGTHPLTTGGELVSTSDFSHV